MGLEERVAIVTGAAQGIGREYAKVLAANGAAVVVADVNLKSANETARDIAAAGGRAIALETDVSDKDSCHRAAANARDAFGAVTILVNNAAIYHSMRLDPLLAVDIGYWRKVFSVNLDGALLMSQAVAPHMIEKGWGRIVNQSSAAAYMGASNGAQYATSKLAMIGLTQGLAAELGRHGITVNAIAPGPIFTEATKATVPAPMIEMLLSMTPINRKVEPDGLNGVLLFLVSD
ncbi:MAG: SDR family NAD(P)-dependent oxidoreductase, partial [Candidatus Binataceae bacterium]